MTCSNCDCSETYENGVAITTCRPYDGSGRTFTDDVGGAEACNQCHDYLRGLISGPPKPHKYIPTTARTTYENQPDTPKPLPLPTSPSRFTNNKSNTSSNHHHHFTHRPPKKAAIAPTPSTNSITPPSPTTTYVPPDKTNTKTPVKIFGLDPPLLLTIAGGGLLILVLLLVM